MRKDGLLLCAKYAVSPNFFGYCGPNSNKSIIDHLVEAAVDNELETILSKFETLYPYLNLIAKKNKIIDPFDFKVVEAYWIGNSFLKPVGMVEYESFTKEKLSLDKKIDSKTLGLLKFKIKNLHFYPHHNFHVFNIFRRTGFDFNWQTLSTMDNCRINWGKLISTKDLTIETRTLIKAGNKLALSQSTVKMIKIDYKSKIFIKNLKTGDRISFHWGFLCDKLEERQVKNLQYFTQKAIDFYNQSL